MQPLHASASTTAASAAQSGHRFAVADLRRAEYSRRDPCHRCRYHPHTHRIVNPARPRAIPVNTQLGLIRLPIPTA